jgi:oligoribonuclease NrnB/cAMP/cGMP phosphodiesterase (DHH superfamily)
MQQSFTNRESQRQRDYMNPDDIDTIIYHANCNDGKAAVACAYKYFGNKQKHVRYYAMNYGNPFPCDIRDKTILLLDFSLKPTQLIEARADAKSIMILDHHETAMKDLCDTDGCFFNIKESGASMAWYYFFPDKPLPLFIEYIKDRDLWTYNHRDRSEPMFYGLTYTPFTEYIKYIDDDALLDELINNGKFEMKKNEAYIKNYSSAASRKLVRVRMGEGTAGKGILYNTMCIRLESAKLVSEIAEDIYKNNNVDFVICWFSDKNNKVPRILEYFADFSIVKWLFGPQKFFLCLRTDEENVDLGQIARIMSNEVGGNGGGHRKSAGLYYPAHPSRFI